MMYFPEFWFYSKNDFNNSIHNHKIHKSQGIRWIIYIYMILLVTFSGIPSLGKQLISSVWGPPGDRTHFVEKVQLFSNNEYCQHHASEPSIYVCILTGHWYTYICRSEKCVPSFSVRTITNQHGQHNILSYECWNLGEKKHNW